MFCFFCPRYHYAKSPQQCAHTHTIERWAIKLAELFRYSLLFNWFYCLANFHIVCVCAEMISLIFVADVLHNRHTSWQGKMKQLRLTQTNTHTQARVCGLQNVETKQTLNCWWKGESSDKVTRGGSTRWRNNPSRGFSFFFFETSSPLCGYF